jgi:hypothetical protein
MPEGKPFILAIEGVDAKFEVRELACCGTAAGSVLRCQ